MSIKIIVKGFLYIPKELFTLYVERSLVFDNPEYFNAIRDGRSTKGISEQIVLYKKVKTKSGETLYRVPRYTFGSLSEFITKYEHKIFMPKPSDIDINWKPKKKFILNDSQIETLKKTKEFITKDYSAIIVAKPGEGKTSMAIKLITEFKQKTLILVHKNSLIKQWTEELLTLTDLKESDIGLLQQGKFIDGKVVIGSQASLMRNTISRDINKLFPMKIQDEFHLIGSKMFLRANTRFNSTMTLSLSATPFREDGLEKLYFLHSSNNIVKHRTARNVNSKYYSIGYNRKTKYRMLPYLPYRIGLIQNIIEDEDRNDLLMRLLKAAVKDGRRVIMVSDRINHLKLLMDRSLEMFPNKKIVRFFNAKSLTKKEKRMGIKQEKVIPPTREEMISADIIFGSYKKIKDGENIPQIDTLIFCTPVSSAVTVEQIKGRIEREYKGKQFPLVIDIIDNGSSLTEGMYNKRKSLYNSFNMEYIDLSKKWLIE